MYTTIYACIFGGSVDPEIKRFVSSFSGAEAGKLGLVRVQFMYFKGRVGDRCISEYVHVHT